MIRVWRYPLVGHGDTRLYTFLRWLAIPFFGGVYRCRVQRRREPAADGAR